MLESASSPVIANRLTAHISRIPAEGKGHEIRRHEIGPRMPARIAKHTGLKPEDRLKDKDDMYNFPRGKGTVTGDVISPAIENWGNRKRFFSAPPHLRLLKFIIRVV
jgi:hypothetical protein